MKDSMKEESKKLRMDMLLSSLFCILFGLVLLICPGDTLKMIAYVAAVVLLVIGAGLVISFFCNWVTEVLSASLGLVLVVVGIWVLRDTGVFINLIPMMMGLVILTHGVQALKIALDTRRINPYWGVALGFAFLSILFGLYCIFCAFAIMKLVMQAIGVILLIDGAANLWITLNESHAAKKYEKRSAADAEFEDDDL